MTNDETPPPSAPKRRHVVLLTGLSGAGLSTALKAFEDLGYEAVDNLRLSLVPALVEDAAADCARALAVVIDTRNPNFATRDFLDMAEQLDQSPEIEVKLVFLECSDEELQRRFTETRRRHPLALDRPVSDGIQRERAMLEELRDVADEVIDTSQMSLHDLRRLVGRQHRLDRTQGLSLFVMSFSFRHGLPREADLVFDARFLANPHWDPKLRPLTGQDPEVAAFIQQDKSCASFLANLSGLLLPLLPRYQDEGRSYLTIAIGCTGGRHRSVYVAENLANVLASHDYIVGIVHRDMERPTNRGTP
ncbi:MAG: RNase adapter RapZ [Alphaproteobacteria bacterium]|nr:RNase adapter RapZ [Alphaproteobacteria bacterium]